MSAEVLAFAAGKADEGERVALVCVTGTEGSSPASVGQMMAVLANGEAVGTVGGGASEFRLKERAVQAICRGEAGFEFHFDHSEMGMVCGGGMQGYGTVVGAGQRLVLFGGGHVAQQVARVAAIAGFHVTVVEDRPELAADFAGVQYITCTAAEYAARVRLDKDCYAVIATRGHRWDDEALRYCLTQSPRYVGMIGSKNKVRTVLDGLRAEGVPEETLRHIHAPIGLNVASGVPGEIAVAIVAELLLVKNGGSPAHKKLT